MGPRDKFNFGGSTAAAFARTRKILVVDDEPVMLKLLEASLREAGFEHLIFAQNGSEVPSLATQERPQLIIMDVMMPKGNGLRALRILKDNVRTAAIPVILTSGFDVQTLGECAREQASFLVPKPFSPELMLSHVEELLSAKGESALPSG
jgi:two-component system, OmpR family, alkaline phosphatase synthesis response regulator PhoP